MRGVRQKRWVWRLKFSPHMWKKNRSSVANFFLFPTHPSRSTHRKVHTNWVFGLYLSRMCWFWKTIENPTWFLTLANRTVPHVSTLLTYRLHNAWFYHLRVHVSPIIRAWSHFKGNCENVDMVFDPYESNGTTFVNPAHLQAAECMILSLESACFEIIRAWRDFKGNCENFDMAFDPYESNGTTFVNPTHLQAAECMIIPLESACFANNSGMKQFQGKLWKIWHDFRPLRIERYHFCQAYSPAGCRLHDFTTWERMFRK